MRPETIAWPCGSLMFTPPLSQPISFSMFRVEAQDSAIKWQYNVELMSHFTDQYADEVNAILHSFLPATYFYKQEIIDIEGRLTALVVTYDGVRDDQLTITKMSSDEFFARMSVIKDWPSRHAVAEEHLKDPNHVVGGWESRTLYLIKGSHDPAHWTREKARIDVHGLLVTSAATKSTIIQSQAEQLSTIPPGMKHFRMFEHTVRVIFNFLFFDYIGEGQAQSRTDPEDEGLEIRDIVFSNAARDGFWKDLKDKYSVSEIVVDAKNKNRLDRDDLRQLYCYLKPALGFWGFIVCRSEQPKWVQAYNRKLFQNFRQERGVLILSDDDLRRMVEIKNHGKDPGEYLQLKMSEFMRSV